MIPMMNVVVMIRRVRCTLSRGKASKYVASSPGMLTPMAT